jgi:hypothetical protein
MLFEKPRAAWIGRAANQAGASVNSNNSCTLAVALRQNARLAPGFTLFSSFHLLFHFLIPVLCCYLYLDILFFTA